MRRDGDIGAPVSRWRRSESSGVVVFAKANSGQEIGSSAHRSQGCGIYGRDSEQAETVANRLLGTLFHVLGRNVPCPAVGEFLCAWSGKDEEA